MQRALVSIIVKHLREPADARVTKHKILWRWPVALVALMKEDKYKSFRTGQLM